jgi:hypothetical protein
LFYFKCFRDKDLNIPKEFASKIIPHSLDNDCSTDEEQIQGAIRNQYKSLREFMHLIKQQ